MFNNANLWKSADDILLNSLQLPEILFLILMITRISFELLLNSLWRLAVQLSCKQEVACMSSFVLNMGLLFAHDTPHDKCIVPIWLNYKQEPGTQILSRDGFPSVNIVPFLAHDYKENPSDNQFIQCRRSCYHWFNPII